MKSLPVSVGSDIFLVVPERCPREAGLEHLDGIEDKSGPDFGQGSVFLDDLVVPEPDFVVHDRKCEDMVKEGLAPGMVIGNTKNLLEQNKNRNI